MRVSGLAARWAASRPLLKPLLALSLLLAALALYLLRLDEWAGLIGDDAWYIVLAQAIADGSGLRLVNSAGPQVVSQVYPPGFPAILSLIVLINPQFPSNLALLKSVSVTAMLGVGLLTYRYARSGRHLSRPLALGVAVATVVTPSLVFLATSTVMSECVFTLVQLAAVLLTERAARNGDERAARGVAAVAGLVAAAALLIRTAGLTVFVAGLLYLAYKRLWWRAVCFGIAAWLGFMPWWLYAHANAPTRAELVENGGLMAVPYADQFWTREAGEIRSRQIGARELPARVALNLANIAMRDVGGIIVPALFRTPGESGVEVIGLGPPEEGLIPRMGSPTGTKVVSLALTALILGGFAAACRRRITMAEFVVPLSVAMIAAWPFWTFRFVLPLTPFLLGYLLLGAERVTVWLSRMRPGAGRTARLARILVLTIIGLNVWDHGQYVVQGQDPAHRDGMVWRVTAEEIRELARWMRAYAMPGAPVASDNPALVYLLTGHPTVAMDSVGDNAARWTRLGVKYVVCVNGRAPLTDVPGFQIRFKLAHRNMWVAEIEREPDVPERRGALAPAPLVRATGG